MPYGTQEHSFTIPVAVVTNGFTKEFANIIPDNGSERWIRSGTNTAGYTPRTAKQPRLKPPLVWKSFPSGAKTGKKVWVYSKKLGRHVKVAERLFVQKLVPDYSVFPKRSKKKRPKARKYTTPNSFNFEKVSVKYSAPEGAASYYRTDNFSSGGISGNLLAAQYSDYRNYQGLINDGFSFQGYCSGGRQMPDYDGILSRLDDQALNKLYSKIKDQEINIAQALAESNQTIRLINEGLFRIAKTVAELSRGRVKKAFKELFPHNKMEAASLPLIIDFGIRPLMNDIEGLTKELWKTESKIRVVKAVCKEVFDGFVFNSDVLDNNQVVRAQTQVQLKAKLTVRYVATIEVQNKFFQKANSIGFTNWASVLWELTPWSFVIDWFIPIGNYINNMDATFGWKVIAVHRTVHYEQEAIGTRTISGATSTYVRNTGSGFQHFNVKSVQVNRTVLTNLPALPVPMPRNPFKLNRAVDALALFNQFLLRKSR